MAVYAWNNNKQIAYLIGAFIGDGSFVRAKKYRYPRIFFSSSDVEFVKVIKTIIQKRFNLNLKINKKLLSKKNKRWKDHYRISSRKLYPLLCNYLPSTKSIPSFIMKGDQKIKEGFLSGFFDAEEGVCISWIKSRNAIDRRIYCTSTNKSLLKSMKKFLKELKIDSFIQWHKKGKGYFSLNIWGYKNLNQFRKKINFIISRKANKLKESIESYKQIHVKWDKKIYKLVMKIRKDYSHGARNIKKQLEKQGIDVPQPTIEKWIYRR